MRKNDAEEARKVKLPTPEEIEAAKTANGGWTREQLAAWGVSWPPPKGWRKALEERAKRDSR